LLSAFALEEDTDLSFDRQQNEWNCPFLCFCSLY